MIEQIHAQMVPMHGPMPLSQQIVHLALQAAKQEERFQDAVRQLSFSRALLVLNFGPQGQVQHLIDDEGDVQDLLATVLSHYVGASIPEDEDRGEPFADKGEGINDMLADDNNHLESQLAGAKKSADQALREIGRLTRVLHAAKKHPDYSYRINPSTPEADAMMDDSGWEVNTEWHGPAEDKCWRRKVNS